MKAHQIRTLVGLLFAPLASLVGENKPLRVHRYRRHLIWIGGEGMGDNKQNARFPLYDSAKTMRDSKGDHDGGHEHKSLGREDDTTTSLEFSGINRYGAMLAGEILVLVPRISDFTDRPIRW
jgi:hypothetical protein